MTTKLLVSRDENSDCESRLKKECSGCRDKSSSSSHPDSWESGFCSDPTECCSREAAWPLTRLVVQWTASRRDAGTSQHVMDVLVLLNLI